MQYTRVIAAAAAGLAILASSLPPAHAKTVAELACEERCAPLIKAITPYKEMRRVYHNCKTGCMPWTDKSFYICPDGIGYQENRPDVCEGRTKKK